MDVQDGPNVEGVGSSPTREAMVFEAKPVEAPGCEPG